MTTRLRTERGSITAFVAVVALALVMVAGMAYDGGEVIAAHARARNDARKAARAAAQQVDVTQLRATGDITLDPRKAELAATRYLDQVHATGSAHVNGAEVTVTVVATQPLRILPGGDRRIVVTETATALDGPTP